jgi:hypothetical protein
MLRKTKPSQAFVSSICSHKPADYLVSLTVETDTNGLELHLPASPRSAKSKKLTLAHAIRRLANTDVALSVLRIDSRTNITHATGSLPKSLCLPRSSA